MGVDKIGEHEGVWVTREQLKKKALVRDPDKPSGTRPPRRGDLYEGSIIEVKEKEYEIFLYDHVRDLFFVEEVREGVYA